ncbi:hypothetical protein C667_12324 [Thauera phenylacetica B4P]|uniref:Uncharacterized protein n=1 Tax=Thauera phenylacetica B4P TaxID=1234382 RepID=N6ZQF8_9RHOO|nr:hypothetical protein C667_12324 [Thauera phenylacetica B4P]
MRSSSAALGKDAREHPLLRAQRVHQRLVRQRRSASRQVANRHLLRASKGVVDTSSKRLRSASTWRALRVSAPVLSVQITVVAARVSTARMSLITALRAAIRNRQALPDTPLSRHADLNRSKPKPACREREMPYSE